MSEPPPTILIVMGVSGSGKSTIAKELAARLGWRFLEGDDLHPPANVGKMHAGVPLDDADRKPWLDAIAAWIDERLAAGEPGILTCSALKHAYRKILVGAREHVRLVYLKGDKALIARRLSERKGHFMPPSLLDSQFSTLEEPTPDEDPITVSLAGDINESVDNVIAALNVSGRNPRKKGLQSRL